MKSRSHSAGAQWIILACAFAVTPMATAAEPQSNSYQIFGLFGPERQQDFREVVGEIPNVKLVDLDYARATATFEFDPAVAFPGAKSAEIMQRLDNLIRNGSNHTFSLKPLSTTPKEKLQYVEIAVAGLDCKGCSYAAYDAVARINGVELATASFKVGLVTAWIDPARTDRAALEKALKQARVALK